MIAHVATCDADNLGDYQTVLTSTHTNCLIQFVKERLVKSFSSQPSRAFYAFLRVCQAFISKYFARNSFNFKHLTRLRSLVAGGEFYSVTSCCQLPFLPPWISNACCISLRASLRGGE